VQIKSFLARSDRNESFHRVPKVSYQNPPGLYAHDPQVEEIVRKSGVKEGMVLVSAMHITAGVYVNDHESGLIEDIDQWLEHLAPFRKNYKHHETGEDNGDSHLKALLIHHEVIVPITAGKLDLGTWQRIFYAEFDGQRDKRVIVKVMGE
jgi:secondary thiamine-phosphate synthase enzyme